MQHWSLFIGQWGGTKHIEPVQKAFSVVALYWFLASWYAGAESSVLPSVLVLSLEVPSDRGTALRPASDESRRHYEGRIHSLIVNPNFRIYRSVGRHAAYQDTWHQYSSRRTLSFHKSTSASNQYTQVGCLKTIKSYAILRCLAYWELRICQQSIACTVLNP